MTSRTRLLALALALGSGASVLAVHGAEPPHDVRPVRERFTATDLERQAELAKGLSRDARGFVVKDAGYDAALTAYRTQRARALGQMAQDGRAFDELARLAEQADISRERLLSACFGKKPVGLSDADLALTAAERGRLLRALRTSTYASQLQETLSSVTIPALDANLLPAADAGRSLDDAARNAFEAEYMARFKDPSVAQHLKKLNEAFRGGVPLTPAEQERIVALYGKTLGKVDASLRARGLPGVVDEETAALLKRLGSREGMVGDVVTLGAPSAQARAEIQAWLDQRVMPALARAQQADRAWRAAELAHAEVLAKEAAERLKAAKRALAQAQGAEADAAGRAVRDAAQGARESRGALQRLRQWASEDAAAEHLVRRSSGVGQQVVGPRSRPAPAAQVAATGLGGQVKGLAGAGARRLGRDAVGAVLIEAGTSLLAGTPVRPVHEIGLDAVSWTLRVTQARDAAAGIRSADAEFSRQLAELDARQQAGAGGWAFARYLWDVGGIIGRATLRSTWNAARLSPTYELVPYVGDLILSVPEIGHELSGTSLVRNARAGEVEQMVFLGQKAGDMARALVGARERAQREAALLMEWREQARLTIAREAALRDQIGQGLDTLRRAALPAGAVPLGFAVPDAAALDRLLAEIDAVREDADPQRMSAEDLLEAVRSQRFTPEGVRLQHGFLLQRVAVLRARADAVRAQVGPLERHAAGEAARQDPAALREGVLRLQAEMLGVVDAARNVGQALQRVRERVNVRRADVVRARDVLARVLARLDGAPPELAREAGWAEHVAALRALLGDLGPAEVAALDASATPEQGELLRAGLTAEKVAWAEVPAAPVDTPYAEASSAALDAWEGLKVPYALMNEALRRLDAVLERLAKAQPLPPLELPDIGLDAEVTERVRVDFRARLRGDAVTAPVRYEFTFGDQHGEVTTQPACSHVYAQPGRYEAAVAVWAEDPRVSIPLGRATVVVTIEPAPDRAPEPDQALDAGLPMILIGAPFAPDLASRTHGELSKMTRGWDRITFAVDPSSGELGVELAVGFSWRVYFERAGMYQPWYFVRCKEPEHRIPGRVDLRDGSLDVPIPTLPYVEEVGVTSLAGGMTQDKYTLADGRARTGLDPTAVPWHGRLTGRLDWRSGRLLPTRGRLEVNPYLSGTWQVEASEALGVGLVGRVWDVRPAERSQGLFLRLYPDENSARAAMPAGGVTAPVPVPPHDPAHQLVQIGRGNFRLRVGRWVAGWVRPNAGRPGEAQVHRLQYERFLEYIEGPGCQALEKLVPATR